MVRLRILEILEEQHKTKYWLCKRLEMTYTNFNAIVNNTTSSIHFDTLDRISELLNVPVGDLFEQTPNEKK
jgi:DNA-binding Xre family transcriptional regulator